MYNCYLHCKVRKLVFRKIKVTCPKSQNLWIAEMSVSKPLVVKHHIFFFFTVYISSFHKALGLDQCFLICFRGSVWQREVERDFLQIILRNVDLKKIKSCFFISFIMIMYTILYMVFSKFILTIVFFTKVNL